MPTVKIRPRKVAAFVAEYQKRAEQGLMEAARLSIEEARAELIKASSGPHKSADLRRAGHPYSRASPNDAYDPDIINEQTGKFRAAWHSEAPEVQREGGDVIVTARVVNRDPKARFMRGTKRMRARNIVQRVTKIVRPKFIIRARKAMRDARQDAMNAAQKT